MFELLVISIFWTVPLIMHISLLREYRINSHSFRPGKVMGSESSAMSLVYKPEDSHVYFTII
jgi:hypothetical protein